MTSKKSNKTKKKYLTYESTNHINVKKYPILYLSILYHTSSKEKKNKQTKFPIQILGCPPKMEIG